MEKINQYELIGIIVGDGKLCCNNKTGAYKVEITGKVEEPTDHVNEIAALIKSWAGKQPTITIRNHKKGGSLSLYIYIKNFINFLINDLGLKSGPKYFTAEIPEKFLDWQYSKHIIRGLFETDGSLYFSKSKKIPYPRYPRIEIKTSSEILLNQLFALLRANKFEPTTRKSKGDKTFVLLLSGEKMLQNWANKIGFSTIKNLSKYQFFLQKGFYIPNISTLDRLKCLKHGYPSGLRSPPAERICMGSNS